MTKYPHHNLSCWIYSIADYDKEVLSFRLSFEEYKTINDLGEKFHVVVAEEFPIKKDKTPERKSCYTL